MSEQAPFRYPNVSRVVLCTLNSPTSWYGEGIFLYLSPAAGGLMRGLGRELDSFVTDFDSMCTRVMTYRGVKGHHVEALRDSAGVALRDYREARGKGRLLVPTVVYAPKPDSGPTPPFRAIRGRLRKDMREQGGDFVDFNSPPEESGKKGWHYTTLIPGTRPLPNGLELRIIAPFAIYDRKHGVSIQEVQHTHAGQLAGLEVLFMMDQHPGLMWAIGQKPRKFPFLVMGALRTDYQIDGVYGRTPCVNYFTTLGYPDAFLHHIPLECSVRRHSFPIVVYGR